VTQNEIKYSKPYSKLAAGYDVVMRHVDYEDWAAYIFDVLMEHHTKARQVLELGCGTGSLALALQPLGSFSYTGTDHSSAMVRIAEAKANLLQCPVQFDVADFTTFTTNAPVDAVILLHDGLNYLHTKPEIQALFRCAYDALKPGGVFIFDQSTPANSINNQAFFDDAGEAEAFSYVRRSSYDPDRQLHMTEFDLVIQNQTYYEKHIQRAYRMAEIETLILESPFDLVRVYDSFSDEPATDASERLHWVLRRKQRESPRIG
jgi:SAM-dependent methyltransferase